MSKRRILIDKIWIVLLALTPVVLWILPADFFDNGELILCPSRLFFNIECFGCGMTRAIQHMHHFEYQEAFYYNYGSLLVYPGLIFVWFLWLFKALNRLDINPLKKRSKA
jgi:hypothetical protein